jgi:hypothetical protein
MDEQILHVRECACVFREGVLCKCVCTLCVLVLGMCGEGGVCICCEDVCSYPTVCVRTCKIVSYLHVVSRPKSGIEHVSW